MEITSQQNYAATPEQVYAMFTDPAYFETLCREFGAQEHSVNVANNSSQLSLKLPAPQIVQKFAGATLGLNQTITWGEAAADGSRVGQLDMSVDKMPVQVKGTAQLLPSGSDQPAATEEDWETEYLALELAVKIVDDLDAALAEVTNPHLRSLTAEVAAFYQPQLGAELVL